MANCPICGTLHMPSSRTCRVCGASLLASDISKPPVERAAAELEPETELDMPVLMLTAVASGQQLRLAGQPEYLLGRTDPERSMQVDVDMSGFGGWEGGVSRRHARIFCEGGQFFVEDLRSANGTFLNEIRLEPGRAQPLQSGDTIKLGIVRLYVE